MSDSSAVNAPQNPGSVGKVVESVAADLKNVAGQKLEEARAAVETQATDAKRAVAGEVGNVAAALRTAARELRGGSLPEATIGMVANSLADASDAVRDRDFGELLQSLNKVARENPVLFVGGAILFGFAISRFAKASSDLPAHLLTKDSRYKHSDDHFVSEGNPNTDPADMMP